MELWLRIDTGTDYQVRFILNPEIFIHALILDWYFKSLKISPSPLKGEGKGGKKND